MSREMEKLRKQKNMNYFLQQDLPWLKEEGWEVKMLNPGTHYRLTGDWFGGFIDVWPTTKKLMPCNYTTTFPYDDLKKMLPGISAELAEW